ncbi:NADH dehydrogenase subunit 5 (mitochondrion) [Galendromus occidentalis]|uniref:NADH:ubiquinone reductase (H(+)-translocating) n=1 Tax=Galendromus occidentalis TaxID=34638 RepID=A3RE55_9ACAR|nr:NADH dehydrogenase subunit 5 [Galendromus occidentalis]YP_001096008.1 NADH dehydrogenase subunit 5 [Galendromus occidentalis]ABN45832.1 NADH dehydrogenase subunit 5 [Galendromus occidentalis]ABN45843.1 NADH dehydrogenase subunit 5 [Galendromus occidentalis]
MWFFLVGYIFFMGVLVNLFMLYYFILEENFMLLEVVLWDFSLLEVKLYFYVDYMSVLFMLVVSMISMLTFFFSSVYMGVENNKYYFIILTFIFVISMFIVILGMNLWMILLGWDMLGVVSYFLVVFYNSEMSNYSGIITVMTNRWGDVGLILSLFFFLNDYSFDIISEASLKNLFFIFLLMSCFTKSAQFPFSAWLPLAMAAPTPISALVHSSTLVTAGVYLFIRFSGFFKNNSFLLKLVLLLSVFTLSVAGVMAFFEMDLKKVIAFSTLSQLSLMMIVLFLGNEVLSFFHILSHALYKAMLFLCSGVLIHESGNNQDIRGMNKVLKSNKLVPSVLLVCSLSLMGFPFLSGFYSKDLIMEMVFSLNFNVFFFSFMVVSVVLTVIYSLRLIYYSVLMGKMGGSFNFVSEWNFMYLVLMLGGVGVLFLGSLLNWLMIEKLEFIFLIKSVKSLCLVLVLISFFFYFCVNMDFLKILKNKQYMYTSFFLVSFQGAVFNVLFNKTNYMVFYFEQMFESSHSKVFYVSVEDSIAYLGLIKYFYFYFSLMGLLLGYKFLFVKLVSFS